MHRWIARILLVVVLVPAFAPLALAGLNTPAEAMHCQRKPMMPAMHCHGAMAMSPEEASGSSFRAINDCCANHDCCRGTKTSEWARPEHGLSSWTALPVAPVRVVKSPVLVSSVFAGPDSARAPPQPSC